MQRYLLFITKPYSFSVAQPLLAAIRCNPDNRALVYLLPELAQLAPADFPVTTDLEKAMAFDPQAVFVPGNIVHDKLPGLKVQIFHGLCEEKGGHYKITGFFDLYCTSGPLITRKFQQLAWHYQHFAVRETGWPKVDYLLAPFERSALCNRLGVNPQNKLIAYCPTFSPKFKSSLKIYAHLQALPKDDETWLIKFHDLMPAAEVKHFMNLTNKKIKVYQHHDNVPLLKVADVMISDTSSIVYEFMLLDKPVITIDARVRLEKGINITSLDKLRAAVDHARQYPWEDQWNRYKVLDQIHPYRDRHNSQRVLDATQQALDENLSARLKSKPLNLLRKYKARKKFGYW